MNWQEFTALLVLSTAMSFSPGPNTTTSTTLAANHGLRRAMPFVYAVPVGWCALMLVCALGVGALVIALPPLAWAIRIAGVTYLLWLAGKLATSHRLGEADATRMNVGFLQGVALQFVNIKVWMLALAIASGWIAGRENTALRLAIVLAITLVLAFASNLSYALAGSLLRGWLAGPNGSGLRLKWFNRTMALVLVATALWMLFL